MVLYIIIGIVIGVLGGAIVVWFFLGRTNEGSKVVDQSMILLQHQLQELARTLDVKVGEFRQEMRESTRNVHDSVKSQLSESASLIRDITGELVKVGEGQKQVANFADQLRNLQDILKNPKQRGILGEYYLETLLKNVLPTGSFQMQYAFDDGTIVDGVVFVKDKIIPVDSKFSLENYNRLVEERDEARRAEYEKEFRNDLKKRIDETAKYVKPDEGTMDFAFMFIPHEAIYYDLLVAQVGAVKVNTRDLVEYAFKEKRVIIVSPTSFLAYLQTVLQGLKALQIEEQAVDIRKRVEELGKHLLAYDDYMKKMGTTLGTTVSHYNNAYKEFKKVDKDILRVTGQGVEIEPLVLEKPQIEE